mmetsp:Transcript_83617/g.132486  ORF Transcript_83617/g.132486 Transcript_83617/m.132486 type:complete len:85 (+) Transcript_83617:71-325(+)
MFPWGPSSVAVAAAGAVVLASSLILTTTEVEVLIGEKAAAHRSKRCSSLSETVPAVAVARNYSQLQSLKGCGKLSALNVMDFQC